MEVSADEEIDGTGMWLFPGLIDMHVHLREPGDEESETVETGLKAAVAGGITTVGVMPNTDPPMDDVRSVRRLKELADKSGLADVIPVPSVTRRRAGRELVDFEALHSEGASVFTDDGDPVRDPALLLKALESVSRFNGVIMEHPETTELSGCSVNRGAVSKGLGLPGIPALAETVDVSRCLEVAAGSEGRLHLTHLSLPRSVRLAKAAVFSRADVTLDVTPHHIALDETALLEHGSLAKMNPPLRGEEQRKELAEMVCSGLVDAVVSDHAPHCESKKDGALFEAAFGITGMETLLPVTLEVLIKLGMPVLEILRLLTTGPAGILDIPEPSLEEGAKADLVLFDPDETYTLQSSGTFSRSRNTPFMKRELRGRVKAVWKERLVYRDGQFV